MSVGSEDKFGPRAAATWCGGEVTFSAQPSRRGRILGENAVELCSAQRELVAAPREDGEIVRDRPASVGGFGIERRRRIRCRSRASPDLDRAHGH